MKSTLPLSSTAESCITAQHPQPPTDAADPRHILEISLISAQDLTPVYKSMQTYAVAWIDPARKQTTLTDHKGNKNPTWDEKLSFPLYTPSEDTILTVEIYTASWIRDVLVGMVKAPVMDLLDPGRSGSTRFVALQILRTSGDPQGILNIGVALVDFAPRISPVSMQEPKTGMVQIEVDDDTKKELNEKINLWRSMSMGSSQVTNEEYPVKVGSVYNASEICSDIGPSASIVAMEIAKKVTVEKMYPRRGDQNHSDTGSSIIEEMTIEDARARGYGRVGHERRRKGGVSYDDESELLWDGKGRRRHSRVRSDGNLLACLVCGVEFRMVCGGGGSKNGRGNKGSSRTRRRMSTISESNAG